MEQLSHSQAPGGRTLYAAEEERSLKGAELSSTAIGVPARYAMPRERQEEGGPCFCLQDQRARRPFATLLSGWYGITKHTALYEDSDRGLGHCSKIEGLRNSEIEELE
jgi:hypothetical protein